MKHFIIILATVLFVFAGHGICEDNPAKTVKLVDTIYLLNSDGSVLNKYSNVVVTSYNRDERIIRFVYRGKEISHEGNVLMKGVESRKSFDLRKSRMARQKIGIE
jgi:hypothetical protein